MPTTEAQRRAYKKWRDANTEKAREANKKWREENKEKFNRDCLEYYYKKKTPEQLDRMQQLVTRRQSLINMYDASRSTDSPITVDEENMSD